MTTKTVLLVHGAWHGAWCWATLQAELDRRGVPSLAIDLPGHGLSPLAFTDLHGDAQHVADALARINGPVVLVGHSYGGAVITEAATRHADNVSHLVYMTALALDKDEAVLPFVQSLPRVESPLGAAMLPSDDGAFTTIDPTKSEVAFYGECPKGTTEAANARLCAQPVATFLQPVSGAAWRTIPSTYIECTLDGAIPIEHQRAMSSRCTNVVTLETDHSPFTSKPSETADVLERLARA
jgi:pimeloyl-ACP methyl ester carboxylesterase